MHATAFHLIPILGAEKSRVVFYVFASSLAAWAVLVSVGIGLRRPGFPANVGGQRLVMLVSSVLVIATMASGVITASAPSKANSTQPSSSRVLPGAGSASSSVQLAADPGGQLAYNTKQLQAKAGQVTITMTNMSPLEHNVAIAEGTVVLGATPTFKGGSKTLTLDLKPGTYTFYCSVPGHREAGMQGTLRVS